MNSNNEIETAKRSGEEMMANDKAARALGIELVEIAPGFAKMTMQVRNDMLNGFAICHGGMTFSLADTAFAYACNSRNKKTVALQCTINYTSAAHEGDTLTAVASESSLAGRTGVYDITITNQHGKQISFFRGTSYATSSSIY